MTFGFFEMIPAKQKNTLLNANQFGSKGKIIEVTIDLDT